MSKVYLAGAIFGLPDRGQTWRLRATDMMPKGWVAVNPNLVELELKTPAAIVKADYAAILTCQAIIARVDHPSWGTAMELAFAKQNNIPVIGWATVRRKNISPWLYHHLTIMVFNIEDAVGELKHVREHHSRTVKHHW